MSTDVLAITSWWGVWLLCGISFFPATKYFFSRFPDHGWVISKALGGFVVTYISILISSLKIFPYGSLLLWTILGISFFTNWLVLRKRLIGSEKVNLLSIITLEIVFLGCMFFWGYIKAFEPSINSLEKFMDYGFASSIIKTEYFPPEDMWWSGKPINYYYLGHALMASINIVSGTDLEIGYNVMLVSLFSLGFGICASIGLYLGKGLTKKRALLASILIPMLVILSGNLHTVYVFTTGYTDPDNPTPFWRILTNPFENGLWQSSYWYPNATRFIPFTIHEFPSYSFVVSDVHGHVLSIPLALILISIFLLITDRRYMSYGVNKHLLLSGFVLGMAFMTNALDGPIYLGLILVGIFFRNIKKYINISHGLLFTTLQMSLVLVIFGVTSAPFLRHFESFVSGIGVNCAPGFLAQGQDSEAFRFGPFLFEEDKCQRSEPWMMMILWGLFAYFAVLTFINRKREPGLFLITSYCVPLIFFAEFFYFKDIYPQHFRSNTMFKLGYQAFIMLSIASGYIFSKYSFTSKRTSNILFSVFGVLMTVLVMIYPFFSVKSYFGNLNNHVGLYGMGWFEERYPQDFEVVEWMKNNIPQKSVVLEAPGDSYTDYNRVSVITGNPTVVGWGVHQWLWRGGWDIVSKRVDEVNGIYEGMYTPNRVYELFDKYNIEYIFVGELEREKYKNINEMSLGKIGEKVYQSGTSYLIKVSY